MFEKGAWDSCIFFGVEEHVGAFVLSEIELFGFADFALSDVAVIETVPDHGVLL